MKKEDLRYKEGDIVTITKEAWSTQHGEHEDKLEDFFEDGIREGLEIVGIEYKGYMGDYRYLVNQKDGKEWWYVEDEELE